MPSRRAIFAAGIKSLSPEIKIICLTILFKDNDAMSKPIIHIHALLSDIKFNIHICKVIDRHFFL